jgi:ABC-2 type transport system ATP-binding protein
MVRRPLELRGLVKSYSPGAPNAVDGIDLAVEHGEVFGLLGPNGAGKTTTVGIATTRVLPTSGTVLVNGIDVVADPARAKSSLGVVTQFNTLDRACTVGENLVFHCRFFGASPRAARHRADELLERFRLADRGKDMVTELSGGLAQRVQVARAIAHRPTIVFLDEPTAGLDPQSRIALWEVLEDLRGDEGLTVVLTTHYMEEAEQFCDRVAIIDRGRILVCGAPEALKRERGDLAVATLKFGDEDAAHRAARELRAFGSVEEDGATLRVMTSDGAAAVPGLVQGAGPGLRELSLAEPSLETVFIALTGRELRE